MSAISKIVPIKERQVKQNSQEWFDREIADEIKNCNKVFQKFEESELHIGQDIHNMARYKERKIVSNKKKIIF